MVTVSVVVIVVCDLLSTATTTKEQKVKRHTSPVWIVSFGKAKKSLRGESGISVD